MTKARGIREPGNFYTHIIPAILGIPAGYFMLLKADTNLEILSTLIYTVCFVLLFTTSALYHAVPKSTAGIALWRRFDHASIYLMIAGTYTPTLLGLYDGWFL